MADLEGTIKDLVETLEDGRDGFRKVAEKMTDDGHPDLASQMSGFADQRSRMSSELRDIAAGNGISIEESGSLAAAAHRGWMDLKDALTGDDPGSVLAAAEQGEDHAVEEFESALEDDDLTGPVRDVVTRQLAEIRSTHDQVKALRDRFND